MFPTAFPNQVQPRRLRTEALRIASSSLFFSSGIFSAPWSSVVAWIGALKVIWLPLTYSLCSSETLPFTTSLSKSKSLTSFSIFFTFFTLIISSFFLSSAATSAFISSILVRSSAILLFSSSFNSLFSASPLLMMVSSSSCMRMISSFISKIFIIIDIY